MCGFGHIKVNVGEKSFGGRVLGNSRTVTTQKRPEKKPKNATQANVGSSRGNNVTTIPWPTKQESNEKV